MKAVQGDSDPFGTQERFYVPPNVRVESFHSIDECNRWHMCAPLQYIHTEPALRST